MRKEYSKISIQVSDLASGNQILTGSATNTKMKIGGGTAVESFNKGFEDSDGNDFATISFD